MTDEEKAKEYIKSKNWNWEQNQVVGDEVEQAYLDGLAEGRKEIEQWKQEWQDAQIKANEEGFARTTLQIKYTELEKENIKLLDKLNLQNQRLNELKKENEELNIKLKGALDICNIPEFRINDLEKENVELKEENKELKNVIEEAIKDHRLFRQNEVIDFTSKCVWKALNPDTKMCVPNAMFIKIEELLKDYIEKELAK